MKIRFFKKQVITKLLTLLGFGATAFAFVACYGTAPDKYLEQTYSDSIRTVMGVEDSIVIASDGTEADALPRHEGASRSPGNSGNTYK